MKQISLLEHPQTFVRNTVLALSGSLLLAVSAQIEIPLWPVPITGQTFALYIIAAMFGARLGFYTVLLYLLEGSMGLPVFSGGSFGIITLFGPTGGYLAGMLISVYLMGWYFEQNSQHSFGKTIKILTLGTIFIFLPGLLWLSVITKSALILKAGLFPFLPGAVIKIGIASTLISGNLFSNNR